MTLRTLSILDVKVALDICHILMDFVQGAMDRTSFTLGCADFFVHFARFLEVLTSLLLECPLIRRIARIRSSD